MKSFLNILYGVLIGLLAGGLIWLAARGPHGEAVTLLSTPTEGNLIVYVSGAVATPGVYSLPPGSRLDAAIKAAGGFVAGAETERVNLAAILVDGEQVDIPGLIDTGHLTAGRVDINTASVSDLNALPGITLTTAQSIIDYRLAHGPFQFIQDLLNVPGIGPETLANIQDYITTNP